MILVTLIPFIATVILLLFIIVINDTIYSNIYRKYSNKTKGVYFIAG
uniref:Uncharacterized protein n=1 Tax=Amphimedon queenslandica TaxID=400682 RepID=A0A1X7VD26_AMPQE